MTDTTPTSGTGPADDYAAQIRAVVDAAPPLSVRQRERLRLIFRTRRALARADPNTVREHRAGPGSTAA